MTGLKNDILQPAGTYSMAKKQLSNSKSLSDIKIYHLEEFIKRIERKRAKKNNKQ